MRHDTPWTLEAPCLRLLRKFKFPSRYHTSTYPPAQNTSKSSTLGSPPKIAWAYTVIDINTGLSWVLGLGEEHPLLIFLMTSRVDAETRVGSHPL